MSGTRKPWFRHYFDSVHSRKLRVLTDRQERVFWWFCCLHQQDHLVGRSDEDVAWEIRMDPAEVAQMRRELAAAGLLDPDGSPHDFDWWNTREEPGASTARVREHRKRNGSKKQEQRKRNDDVTETKRKDNGLRAEQSRAEQNIPRRPIPDSEEALEQSGVSPSPEPPVRSRSLPDRNRNGNRPMSRKQAAVLERAASEHDLNLARECNNRGIEYDPVLGPMSHDPQQLYDDILGAVKGVSPWPLGKAPRVAQDERSGREGINTPAEVLQSLQTRSGAPSYTTEEVPNVHP